MTGSPASWGCPEGFQQSRKSNITPAGKIVTQARSASDGRLRGPVAGAPGLCSSPPTSPERQRRETDHVLQGEEAVLEVSSDMGGKVRAMHIRDIFREHRTTFS